MNYIRKSRREWFGGIVYSEHPGFMAFVDTRRADCLGIPHCDHLPDGLLSAPLDVHLSITNRCNLGCPGCYAREEGQRQTDMPFSLAQQIIDRLADMNVFTVALGGGEPLLHPQLFEIAAYARARSIVPNMTTNGLCIDSATANQCRAFGCIHLSCHQASELGRLSGASDCLHNAGIDVGLNVLVSAETYHQVPAIVTWCADHRVSRILFLKFKLTANNRRFAGMLLSRAQEQALLPVIRRLSRTHGVLPMLDCSLFPALAAHRPKKRLLEFFDVNGCLGGIAYLAITNDGMVKPCSFCDASIGGAEILNRESWLTSAALQSFRNNRQGEQCATCTYVDLCNGGCRVCSVQCCQTN